MRMSAAEFRQMAKPKPSKYGNEPVWIDGIRFESMARGKRYAKMKLLQSAGEIAELELQPKFKMNVNGVQVCTYIGDLSYWHFTQRSALPRTSKAFLRRLHSEGEVVSSRIRA